jgi:hypothetical protein
MRRTKSNSIVLPLLAASLCLQGCVLARTAPSRPARASAGQTTGFSRDAVLGRIDADELDRLTNSYADGFRTRIEDAVAEIVRGNASAHDRAIAQRMLVESTSSVYDIATSGDPATQVLDLTVAVTLMSQVWIDQDRVQVFRDNRGARLVTALREAREDIWSIAARVYSQDQLLALDFIIKNWMKENPGIEDVYWVRFSDMHEDSLVREIEPGGEYYDAVGAAIDQAKSYERLLERIFYLAKRGPTLAGWQSQAIIDETLAKREVEQVIQDIDTISRSIDELTKTVPEIIAREREAVFSELDRRQKEIDATLASVKSVVDASAPIVRDVNTLAETSERMLGKVAELKGPPDPSAPPSKPFDPDDYTRLLAQASTTLRDADALADSKAMKTIVHELNRATDERIRAAEEAVTRIVWRAGGMLAALIALFFAGLIGYRRMRSAA